MGIDKEAHLLSVGEMATRAFVMHHCALVIVRLGARRFMGKSSPFDLVVGIMVGSVFSRAITGQSPFLPTVAAGAMLIGTHWAFASLAFRSERFSALIKGKAHVLIRDGKIVWDQMRKQHIGKHDLMESLRLQGKVEDAEQVRLAVIERSGSISVLPREAKARVIDVKVAEGVQTVRIEIES